MMPHSTHLFFFLTLPPPPRSTLFPYTTLFRSVSDVGFEELAQAAGTLATQQSPGTLRPWQSPDLPGRPEGRGTDRKSTRLNSSHVRISYAVFCLKKKIQAPSN